MIRLVSPTGEVSTPWGEPDQGNHAVRLCSFNGPKLMTMVGDPGQAETRWGLLRDGMRMGLDERFAALEAPRTIAANPGFPATYLVTAGTCVGEILPATEGRDQLAVADLACPMPVCAEQSCMVRVSVATTNPEGLPSARMLSCTVDFLDADGALVERRRGEGLSSAPLEIVGGFAKPGRGAVVVRCTTDQGVSAGARLEVAVAP